MPRFSAIICDIDGCLGPESTAPLDIARLQRIADHNARAIDRGTGAVLTLCSGRPQPFVECLCRVLHNRALPCVAENGVWLFDPEHNQFERDPTILPTHLHAVHEMTEWLEEEFVPKGVLIQPGKTASISLWHQDTAWLMGHMPAIRQHCEQSGWPMRVSRTIAWINCDLMHVSKSTGIDRFMKRMGLAKESLAGIGDAMSDLAIADRVAWFACPANAVEELKAHAHYVSPHAEVEGVIDILEKIESM